MVEILLLSRREADCGLALFGRAFENRGLSLFSRDVKKCADGFDGRWETAPQGETAMGPSKTIGFIAIVLLVILITGYALGDDGTAPTAEQIAEQQR